VSWCVHTVSTWWIARGCVLVCSYSIYMVDGSRMCPGVFIQYLHGGRLEDVFWCVRTVPTWWTARGCVLVCSYSIYMVDGSRMCPGVFIQYLHGGRLEDVSWCVHTVSAWWTARGCVLVCSYSIYMVDGSRTLSGVHGRRPRLVVRSYDARDSVDEEDRYSLSTDDASSLTAPWGHQPAPPSISTELCLAF